jgi:hypothetical protein
MTEVPLGDQLGGIVDDELAVDNRMEQVVCTGTKTG